MNGFTSPNAHPVGLLLPAFTFLTGPNGVGKTSLANMLFDSLPGMQAYSFAAPIDNAIRGIFFHGDISINLKHPEVKTSHLPGVGITVREAKNKLGDALRSIFGPRILGELALANVQGDSEYFSKFVFDDARRVADVAPIISAFGAENCLLVKLSRPGFDFNQPLHFLHDEALLTMCPVIEVNNDAGLDVILSKLETSLKAFDPSSVLPQGA